MTRSINKFSVFILAMTMLLLLAMHCSVKVGHPNETPVVEFDSEWQYRRGDSPVDSSGHFIWLDDSLDSPFWTSVNSIQNIPSFGSGSVWIRTRLPNTEMLCPAIYCMGMRQIAQIYLEKAEIYEYGSFASGNGHHFKGWHGLLIHLPDNYQKKTLSFRIWSDGPYIGIGTPLYLGPADEMLNRLFIGNLDEIMFASLFLFLGAALFVLYLMRNRNRFYFSLFLFVTSLGLFTGSNSLYLQTVINAPHLFFYLDFFSLFTMPVAALLLIEQIIIEKYRNIIKWLWQVHLVFLLIAIYSVFFLDYAYVNLFYMIFFPLASLGILVSFISIIMSLKKGGREIVALLIGLLVFYVFAAAEIFFYYGKRSVMELSFRIGWIHIGALCFVISLIWILVYRYSETYRQKEAAQREALESALHSERLKGQITLKQVESEKFKDLDRMKSQFFANISHEFRTPLTLILGTARQILDSSTDEDVRSKLKTQIKSGKRLLRLVNELLDLSRLEAGRMNLKATWMDLCPLVRGICETFEPHAREQQIDLVFTTDLDEALICADREKIEKVVSNLVSNALKFTSAGNHIEVSISQGQFMEIRVADTGIGIDESHLPFIFDRFYQVDENSTMPDQQGSGIGLALARELVRLHQGDITVQSEAGKGSVFTVKLPLGGLHLSADELTATPASVSLQRKMSDSGDTIDSEENFYSELRNIESIPSITNPRGDNVPIILIAEDNADLRAYICEELSGHYHMIEAEDGEAGFQQAAQYIPDLVISDVMMPKMDGYQLCEKLKTDERTSHIPVVLLTARSDRDSKMEGLTLGADDYVTKPFEPEELRVRVKNLIDQRRKLRERFSRTMTASIAEFAVMPADERFLKRVFDFVESRLDDPDLSVDWLSGQMALSRSQLHRKIHALTNQTVVEFIRTIRMKHAVEMLDRKAATISEIAYQTGFSNPDYFRRCFKKQFDMTPSQYLSSK